MDMYNLNIERLNKIIPDVPLDFYETMHNLGLLMLQDDAHDIGYFVYYNRRHHKYRGRSSPDHVSPFHHWQVGLVFLFLAQVGGLVNMLKQNVQIFSEIEQEEREERRNTIVVQGRIVDNRLIDKMPKMSTLVPKMSPLVPKLPLLV